MLILDAEIGGVAGLDVRISDAKIVEIAPDLARHAGEPVLEARGGALLPGMHDHHLHLFALAAAGRSVRCGPPEIRDARDLARALADAAPAGDWVRGIGYHESVAGEIDRGTLDRWVADRPVRIQHRSGALWVLNSVAVERLGLDRGVDAQGVERDREGRTTGRLYRLDEWLRSRTDAAEVPSLAPVSERLARLGVTGVTDATAANSRDALERLVASVECGELRQRLVVMGDGELPDLDHPAVRRGALKLLLDERDLPPFDALEARIREAHADGRPVAIHCVTRAELVLAASAFASAGSRRGDRIEHAAVAPPDAVELLANLALTVVTQPDFVRARGDAYLADVAPSDRPWLYRCRGFLDASVPLGGSTDAPFGDPDPWRAMRSAVERRTAAGVAMGPEEALSPEEALRLFTSPPDAPGAAPRRVAPGANADLCLLDRAWAEARRMLSSDCVAATLRDGEVVWRRG